MVTFFELIASVVWAMVVSWLFVHLFDVPNGVLSSEGVNSYKFYWLGFELVLVTVAVALYRLLKRHYWGSISQ